MNVLRGLLARIRVAYRHADLSTPADGIALGAVPAQAGMVRNRNQDLQPARLSPAKIF
jgi:hypothetical protein